MFTLVLGLLLFPFALNAFFVSCCLFGFYVVYLLLDGWIGGRLNVWFDLVS